MVRTRNPNRNRDRYRNREYIMGLEHEKLDVYRLSIGYSVDWAKEDTASRKIQRPTDARESISIPIAISIWMKTNPNKRMHWMLILRASDPCRYRKPLRPIY